MKAKCSERVNRIRNGSRWKKKTYRPLRMIRMSRIFSTEKIYVPKGVKVSIYYIYSYTPKHILIKVEKKNGTFHRISQKSWLIFAQRISLAVRLPYGTAHYERDYSRALCVDHSCESWFLSNFSHYSEHHNYSIKYRSYKF